MNGWFFFKTVVAENWFYDQWFYSLINSSNFVYRILYFSAFVWMILLGFKMHNDNVVEFEYYLLW